MHMRVFLLFLVLEGSFVTFFLYETSHPSICSLHHQFISTASSNTPSLTTTLNPITPVNPSHLLRVCTILYQQQDSQESRLHTSLSRCDFQFTHEFFLQICNKFPYSWKPVYKFHKPPKSHTLKLTSTITRSELATLPVLSFDGTKIGETNINLKSASPDTARAVVHRGIITDLNNKRRGTASTLTRAEVRGGGKKPFPQKKLGRARRGSQRTPLRPGGGVVFGPKPRDWSVKINKKEKRLAISTALASAAVNGIVVEEFGEKFEKPKTKDFIEALKRWGIDPKEKSMFFMTGGMVKGVADEGDV